MVLISCQILVESVRTAEGGVNTGGGMDMTKYLSGSYYRLYTLHQNGECDCQKSLNSPLLLEWVMFV